MIPEEIITRLKAGNEKYLTAKANGGHDNALLRRLTSEQGQHPYAVVVTCSDSRVIPEDIFMCGIGELFTIRVAGNVMGRHQLGSIEYAAGHLGCRLVLILGHTGCGAIHATISRATGGFVQTITEEIRRAIGEEQDENAATYKNVLRSMRIVKSAFEGKAGFEEVAVLGGVYDIESKRLIT